MINTCKNPVILAFEYLVELVVIHVPHSFVKYY